MKPLKERIVIATREFTRDFSHITKYPTSRQYIVVNHGKIVGVFTPQPKGYDEWWLGLEESAPDDQPKKNLTLSELRKKYSFHSGEKHLSQRIDEIVYGIKR